MFENLYEHRRDALRTKVLSTALGIALIGLGVVVRDTYDAQFENRPSQADQLAQSKLKFVFPIDSTNWEAQKKLGWRFLENLPLHGDPQQMETQIETEVAQISETTHATGVVIGTPAVNGHPQETTAEFNSKLFQDQAHKQIGFYYRPVPVV